MKARKILFAVLTIASVTLFNACSDDPCDGVTCSGNGTPTEGVLETCECDCDTGFSGDNCEDEDLCITQNVNCLNGGTCADGTCNCASGYEGDSCQTLSRTKFLGTYQVEDHCTLSDTTIFTSIVSASGADETKVLISNFWDQFSNNVIASTDDNTIVIATQEPDNDGFTVQGTGTISGNVITFNYSISDGTDTDVCTSTWTKQ